MRRSVSVLVPLAALWLGTGTSCSATSNGPSTNSQTSATGSGGKGGQGGSSGGTTGSGGTSTGGSTGVGGTGGGPDKCKGDSDCVGDPHGPLCHKTTGACVICLADDDECPSDQYCDEGMNACMPGCKGDIDCIDDPNGYLLCNLQTHKCAGCLSEDDCPPGEICPASGIFCVSGCSPTHDCAMGHACCSDKCYDLSTDLNHCGDCANKCPALANAKGQCLGGVCILKQCFTAFADCNGDMSDGCEWNTLQDGPCKCVPGQTQPCYQGAPGTQGVGPCHAGLRTCDPSGTGWGDCVGQAMPVAEKCNNAVDDDCDGQVDNVVDIDGDGWSVCGGDCCELAGPGCSNPLLVNPGAFEVAGDGIDNDCDGTVDNPVTTSCSAADKLAAVTALDVAKAMDLCQLTTASPPLSQKIWGVISATQLHSDGTVPTGNPANQNTNIWCVQNKQTAVKTKFGTGGVVPTKNGTLAVISTGMARDAADPGWVVPVNGTFASSSVLHFSPLPAGPLGVYLAAHGGNVLPGQCGTATCPVTQWPNDTANDSVDIQLQIRVPTNAQGFSYDFRLFSGEYHTFQCSSYNDYYLALLTSLVPGIPPDHNISFDALHNAVSVNNSFFQDCGGNGKGCGTCPYGTASLAGTGFDQVQGGATEWLTTDAPVVPGEIMTLDLTVFDVGDHWLDTLILLDNFRWQLTPVVLGTHT